MASERGEMMVRSVVVDGPLALRTRRLRAARGEEIGVQIMTLPMLAARLAGGFLRHAQGADIAAAVRIALQEVAFDDIAPLVHLPGMTRAAMRTLDRLWREDTVATTTDGRSRLRDLASLDLAARRRLPPGALASPDLVAAATTRMTLAPRLLGPVTLEDHRSPDPVWLPMLDALSREVPVRWTSSEPDPAVTNVASAVACADPRAECVEALRWLRELVSSGRAAPEQIAIVAASPGSYDEHMLALSRTADLPLHFSHGLPVLATPPGQACAALADVLERGLSQARVRRVLSHGRAAPGLRGVSPASLAGIPRRAPLDTLDQWRRALADAAAVRGSDGTRAEALLAALTEISVGPAGAAAAGSMVLPKEALAIWEATLRTTSCEGIPLALAEQRSPDGREPGASAVWCPADHLIGAPRPWVRMLGLNARVWPRPEAGDPLLPPHILRPPDGVPSRSERDRAAFGRIRAAATGGLVLSLSRRNSQGGRLAPSDLLQGGGIVDLARTRTPEHAFSEADRLRARPGDDDPSGTLSRAASAHRSRRLRHLTPHDGLVRAEHPAIARALDRPQSATSLQLLVRDPLGYVWRYALGWRSVETRLCPLSLDDRSFGDLVHLLLQRTVDALEAGPGFGRAAGHEVEEALDLAVSGVRDDWPMLRATPPPLLWTHTLGAARTLALRGLTLDPPFAEGTRSWTEVRFGKSGAGGPEDQPWNVNRTVTVPATPIRIEGAVDRLELSGDLRRARVTDYKTGKPPANVSATVLDGCSALQRVIYGAAVRQLVPDARVQVRLVYLRDGTSTPHRIAGEELDDAIARMAGHVTVARELLRGGVCLPGPDGDQRWNEQRLAHAAPAENYRLAKVAALGTALAKLAPAWRER